MYGFDEGLPGLGGATMVGTAGGQSWLDRLRRKGQPEDELAGFPAPGFEMPPDNEPLEIDPRREPDPDPMPGILEGIQKNAYIQKPEGGLERWKSSAERSAEARAKYSQPDLGLAIGDAARQSRGEGTLEGLRASRAENLPGPGPGGGGLTAALKAVQARMLSGSPEEKQAAYRQFLQIRMNPVIGRALAEEAQEANAAREEAFKREGWGFQSGEARKGREFSAGEAEKARAFQGQEADQSRAVTQEAAQAEREYRATVQKAVQEYQNRQINLEELKFKETQARNEFMQKAAEEDRTLKRDMAEGGNASKEKIAEANRTAQEGALINEAIKDTYSNAIKAGKSPTEAAALAKGVVDQIKNQGAAGMEGGLERKEPDMSPAEIQATLTNLNLGSPESMLKKFAQQAYTTRGGPTAGILNYMMQSGTPEFYRSYGAQGMKESLVKRYRLSPQKADQIVRLALQGISAE